MSAAIEKPGKLSGGASITMETWQAIRLFHGRSNGDKEKDIIGLTRFAAIIRPIYIASAVDDPYADTYILNIENAIDDGLANMAEYQSEMESMISDTKTIFQCKFNIANSVEPQTLPMEFSNSLAYRGAFLLSAYDRVVKTCLTARHSGFPPAETYRIPEKAAHIVRSVFAMPTGFKYYAITRDDVRQGVGNALEAESRMGKIPADILSGERRSQYAPRIKRSGDDAMRVSDASNDVVIENASYVISGTN